MKQTRFWLPVLLVLTLGYISCGPEETTPQEGGGELTVYCYDSFSSEWGPGPAIAKEFGAKTGATVNLVAPGDAVTVLNRLILEKDRPAADVVVGLDAGMANRAYEAGILEKFEPEALSFVGDDLQFDPESRLIPFDFGHFAIVYDTLTVTKPPVSLEDLTDTRFADALVLMDPRTSSPGLGFLHWTVSVYGDRWPDYWERLVPSILTIADGWSQGYALFTAGEAPLVLSYGTSPVYHVAYEETDRFAAAPFSDGHVRQIEAMGIVKGTTERELAEQFIEHMLSPASQKTIAMANIMFPARDDIPLPEAFDAALRPSVVTDTLAVSAEENDAILNRWTELFGR